MQPEAATAILVRFADVLLGHSKGSGRAGMRAAAAIVTRASALDSGGRHLPLRVLAATLKLSTSPSAAALADARALCNELRRGATAGALGEPRVFGQPWYTAGPLRPFDMAVHAQQLDAVIAMAERALGSRAGGRKSSKGQQGQQRRVEL